jgi:Rod binding domain-containing protein
VTVPSASIVAQPSPAAAAAGAPAAGGRDDTVRAAEAFERLLVAQLSRSLLESASPAGEGAPAAYRDLLPDALTEALMSAGGIGLARTLQEALR